MRDTQKSKEVVVYVKAVNKFCLIAKNNMHPNNTIIKINVTLLLKDNFQGYFKLTHINL